MKKRKPPILAITILAICAVVAFGFNYKSGIDPNAAPEAPKPTAEAQMGESRATQSVAKTAKGAIAQMGGSVPAPTPGRAKGMANGMAMKGPSSITNFKQGSNKPVPNDSSISSQWYQSQSSKN